MSKQDALREELLRTLQASNTANDIQKAMSNLRSLGTAGLNEVNEVLRLLNEYGNELEGKSQFRKAAHQYYTGARVVQEFFADSTEVRNQWYSKAIEMLQRASSEYLAYHEIDAAAAYFTIAAILQLLTTDGNWAVPQEFESFVKTNQQILAQGKWASGCVYVPYDMVGAITNTDSALLERADSYATTYLLVNTKVAELFADAIHEGLQVTRRRMMKNIKLPRLVADARIPFDIIYGEDFEVGLTIKNTGEGESFNVSFSLDAPDKLKLLTGSLKETVGDLKPGHSKSYKYKFNCPSGEGASELATSIAIDLSFTNVIKDTRTSTLGPYDFVIRTFKKADELKDKLNKVKEKNSQKLSELTTPIKHTDQLEVAKLQNSLVQSTYDDITQAIQTGAFVIAEEKITYIAKIVDSTIIPSLRTNIRIDSTLQKTEEVITKITKDLGEVKQSITTINGNYDKIIKMVK